MSRVAFHDKPFDEGTLTKLELFELYAREWLPVFLSRAVRPEVHLFDFFAGPGTDSIGVAGSPLLLLRQVRDYSNLAQASGVAVHVHLFDEDRFKIDSLLENIEINSLRLPTVHLEVRSLPFDEAFQQSLPILASPKTAKLLLMDQFGIDDVTPEVFLKLASLPTCDFLFFVSSATYYRFHNHPAIKQKITRPDDHYQSHVVVLNYYRSLLPAGQRFYLSPFSLKKGPNVYGVVFGSAHPRGMDKFLQVAWQQDKVNGEADFDINRENIRADQMLLPLPGFRPSKVSAFEADLEQRLRDGVVTDEGDVVQLCFDHGVRRQHAEPVLKKLKAEGVIGLRFRVPDITRLESPRPIHRIR